MNSIKKLAAVILAAAFPLISALPAQAVVVTETPTPDRVFYRETAGDTFSGEFGLDKEITNVEAGDDPVFTLSFEGSTLSFSKLMKSVEQTVRVACEDETIDQELALAVYDPVDVTPAKGSVTLTVKNSRTLKPVANAAYTLYQGTKAIKTGLNTDKSGQISVGSLAPGEYELRQASVPKGYKSATGVKFTVTSLDLSGGDKEIRTTEGKKIVAGENEVLIAGKFSPDITLTAAQEKQVSGITVKYENFGATLDKKGEEKTFEYVTLQAAEEEINHLKNSGEICGAVHITYSLAAKSGRSTCNYTQYLTEQEPDPTPVPAPPVNQGGTANTSTATPRPTAAPTPKVTPTPKATASPTPSPLPSLAPVTTPVPTPVTDAQLTIACTSDKDKQAFSFEISGTKADGGTYRKDFKTDADGKLMTSIPAGKYVVTPKNVKGFDLPEPQNIELTGGSSVYLSFEYTANQRDLTLTVLDDDGQPVPGVTVGLFEPGEVSVPVVSKNAASESTDISQTMADIKSQKEADEKLRDPYTKANALYVGKTGEDGSAVLQKVPVSEFVAVPIDFPDGYSAEKIPTEISAGLHEKHTLSCKYVTVDLTVHSNATDSVVVGAEVTLLDGSGEELATWTTDEKAHRLIRVPEGDYSLQITQDGQTDKVGFTVGREKSMQEIQLKTYLPGVVDEREKQGISLDDWESILPFAAGGLVLVAGLIVVLLIYRDSRKRSGGHR